MTSLDFLFWLLIALMGGLTWAIEAGLGQRHRHALASSMLASLGAVLIMMFLLEDNSVMTMIAKSGDPKPAVDTEQQAEEATEQVDFGGTKKKKRAGGADGSTKGGKEKNAKGGASSSSQNDKQDKDGPRQAADETPDDGKIEYSREPFKDCPQCPEMVIMSAGIGHAGSKLDEPGRMAGEAEARQAEIRKPYAIGRMEITRGEFAVFAKAANYESPTQCEMGKRRGRFDWSRPGYEQDERHSVVCVSIRDVQSYLDWLSTKSGRMYALPTEVEWEYAARAGTDTPFWTGDTITKQQANIARSRDGTTPGGLFQLNQFGLSDVAGNAGEIIGDCLPEPGAAAFEPTKTPAANTPCRRIVKGGSWNASVAETRHAARSILLDGTAANFVGFRVIRGVDRRDEHRILTAAEKQAITKAEADALALAAAEEQATTKAKLDSREFAIKLDAATKAKAATRAQAKADAAAKAQEKLLKGPDKKKK